MPPEAMSAQDRWIDIAMTTYEGSSQLCGFCEGLFHVKLDFQRDGIYALMGRMSEESKPCQSVKDFKKAVLDGCHLCWLFWVYLSENTRTGIEEAEWVEYNVIRPRINDSTRHDIQALQQMWKSSDDGPPLGWSDLMLLALDTGISKTDISTRISYSSDSERTYALAKRWLKECSDNHIICRRHVLNDAFLPTRLLDLGGLNDHSISLCLSKSLGPHTKYMTLSHCWGGTVPLTLTSATFAKFIVDIPYFDLPRTFQEAIRITRNFGIRYLWIDSLCIIQESREDWKREAAMMGEVYRHSWCNIAATKARDSRGGCFDERHPLLVSPCRIQTTWPDEPQRTFYCVPDGIWNSQIDACPLSTRGWVFQEIALSPRVLHYGKGQVFWECCELRACESHPGGTEIALHEGTKISLDPHTIQEANKLHFKHTPPEHDKYYIWDNAIHQYSKKDLTFPQKDIFYAVSGIARLVIPPEEHLAGLWNSPQTLVEQLLWHTDLDSSAVRSPRYRAPSWSWASLDSDGIEFIGFEVIEDHLSHSHDLVEILEAKVTLEDSADSYGPVTDGHIKLRGTVITSTISLQGLSGTNICSFGAIQMSPNHDFGELYEGCTVHCLPMRLDTSEENYAIGSFDHIHGLILEPTGVNDHEYFRRGYFLVENEDAFNGNDEEFGANVLRFWNMLLHGPGNAMDEESGALKVEDMHVMWRDIRLV